MRRSCGHAGCACITCMWCLSFHRPRRCAIHAAGDAGSEGRRSLRGRSTGRPGRKQRLCWSSQLWTLTHQVCCCAEYGGRCGPVDSSRCHQQSARSTYAFFFCISQANTGKRRFLAAFCSRHHCQDVQPQLRSKSRSRSRSSRGSRSSAGTFKRCVAGAAESLWPVLLTAAPCEVSVALGVTGQLWEPARRDLPGGRARGAAPLRGPGTQLDLQCNALDGMRA